MRNFYCKDCGFLIGQVGDDDIAVKCPKCRSLNNSALSVAASVTADLGARKLRELGKELGLSFPASMSKTDMAKAINEVKEKR
jgi:phage FluMu protein Com